MTELKSTVVQQQKELQALTAQSIREQATQIQKVNALIEFKVNLRHKWSSATAEAETPNNVNMKPSITRITTSIERPFLRCHFLLITLVLGFLAFTLALTALRVDAHKTGSWLPGTRLS